MNKILTSLVPLDPGRSSFRLCSLLAVLDKGSGRMPASRARATAAARSETPSLTKMLETLFLMVFSVRPRPRAVALVIGPLGLVLGSLFQVVSDDDSVSASLAKIAAHPSGERAEIICDLLAAFMVPAVLYLMRLSGPRAPRLTVAGGDRRTRDGGRMRIYVKWRNEMTDAISTAEHADRRARLSEHVRTLGAAGYVVCDPTYITYLTGFRFLSTERPTVYLQNAAGDDVIFVAGFELERTRAEADFERIETYPEYPGLEHPMRILARVAADLGLRGTIAADHDGYPGILGYIGPKLSEVTGAEIIDIAAQIETMLARKSPAEVGLLRESGRWCSHAHRLLQQYSVPGSTEAEASLRAQSEATLTMLAERGPGGLLGSGDGVKAGYRGQIGHRSAWAHAVAHNIGFEPGHVLVSETGAPVWGYHAELERTMVIGEPTDRMRWLFDHMLAARKAAFDAIVPGATSADVDGAVNAYFERHGLASYWRQHVGHGTGLRVHETPFIDVGNPAPLQPGMVFTVEPGLYDSEVGGFRHSDTVAVTEDGYELLTDYPDDLESLVIPANG